MTRLIPCKGCKRHCRTSETSCPFCGARRLVIGAGVIAFATLAVGWSGDAAADSPRDAGATPEVLSPNATAPVDAGADSGAVDDWNRHEPRPIPIYGMPPSPRSGC